ncbi:MAG TPA: hypothetical protein PKN48_12265 [Bacteroidales bacterium]|nr:hypothetical protein [Bacteroidales bacterium]
MNPGKIKNALLKFLFPDFDELMLFLHSLVAILFIVASAGSWSYLFRLMFSQDSFFHIVLSLLIVLAVMAIILLPVVHAFSKRAKRNWEKKIMLYAIILADYLVAWNVYDHLKGEVTSWLIIFPLINAIQATLMAMGLWFDFITSEKISDEHANKIELVISSILLVTLFVLCHVIWHQYWAVTFSVCIFYATIINQIVMQAYRSIKKIL